MGKVCKRNKIRTLIIKNTDLKHFLKFKNHDVHRGNLNFSPNTYI